MKFVVLLFAFSLMAFADGDGSFESAVSVPSYTGGTDDFGIALLNDWTEPYKLLGLDFFSNIGGSYEVVLASDRDSMVVRAYDPSTGLPTGETLELSSGNDNCFGLAWNNNPVDDTYYTNDWTGTSLYFTDDFGETWSTYPDPSGVDGRGMDFDGLDYWITNGDNGNVWRFRPGVGQSLLSTPEVTGNMSGLAVFPYGSDTGVAITTYLDHYFYFYSWDGTSMTYLGSSECPVTCYLSLGLTYSENSGHLFWSYNANGNYHLAELSFEPASFVNSSWGSIKRSF